MPHKKSIVPKMEADEDIKSLIYEKFKKDFEFLIIKISYDKTKKEYY